MNKNTSFNCNINFSEDITKLNNNFKKVRIRMMHNDANKNGSFFDLESILKAKPTLENIPILGYIEEICDDKKDFRGHEMEYEVVVDENDDLALNIRYKEVPIGVIPKDNNFELVEVDNRLYVEVDGIIWESYSNSGWDIINSSNSKKVSMEISVQDGYVGDDELFHVTNFQFEGLTILGDDIETGMYDTYLTKFSKSNSTYEKYIDAFNKAFNILEGKEDIEVENEVQEIVEETVIEGEVNGEVQEKEEIVVEESQEFTEETNEEVVGTDEEVESIEEIVIEEVTYSKEDIIARFARLAELETFKAEYDAKVELDKLTEDVNGVVAKFDFEEDEISELKEKAMNKEFNLETFELHLEALYGRKMREKKVDKLEFNKENERLKVGNVPTEKVDNKKKMFEEFKQQYL